MQRTEVGGTALLVALSGMLLLSACAATEDGARVMGEPANTRSLPKHEPLLGAECASRYEFRLVSVRADAQDNFGVFNQRISVDEARSVLRESDLVSITVFTTQGEVVIHRGTVCADLVESFVGARLQAEPPPDSAVRLIFPVRIDLNRCERTHRAVGKWEASVYATLSSNGLSLLEGESQVRAYAVQNGKTFRQSMLSLGLSLSQQ